MRQASYLRNAVYSGLAGLALAIVPGCSSGSGEAIANLSFNYIGDSRRVTIRDGFPQPSDVRIQCRDTGGQYQFIHPVLDVEITYETTPRAQRLLEDALIDLHFQGDPRASMDTLGYLLMKCDSDHSSVVDDAEMGEIVTHMMRPE